MYISEDVLPTLRRKIFRGPRWLPTPKFLTINRVFDSPQRNPPQLQPHHDRHCSVSLGVRCATLHKQTLLERRTVRVSPVDFPIRTTGEERRY